MYPETQPAGLNDTGSITPVPSFTVPGTDSPTMKTIGIIGVTSRASTVDYYRYMNGNAQNDPGGLPAANGPHPVARAGAIGD